MADAVSHATLTVLGGPLDGRQLVLDQAVDEVLIGSDPDCGFFLDLPTVSPIHARLWMDQQGVQVHDTRSPQGIYVNDDPIDGKSTLRDGDIVWLGAPGGEGSVMLQWRQARAASAPVESAFAPGEFGGEEVAPEVFGSSQEPLADVYDEDSPFVVTEETAASWPPVVPAQVEDELPAAEEPLTDFAASAPEMAAAEQQDVDDDLFPGQSEDQPPAASAALWGGEAAPIAATAAAAFHPDPVPSEVSPAEDIAFEEPAYEAAAVADPGLPAFDAEAATPGAAPGLPSDGGEMGFVLDAAAPEVSSAAEAPVFTFDETPAIDLAPVPEIPAERAEMPSFEPPSALFDGGGNTVEEPAPPSRTRLTSPPPAEPLPEPVAARTTARPAVPVSAKPPGRGGAQPEGGNTARNAGIGVAALVILGLAGYFGMRAMSAPSLTAVAPARVARGATLTLSGEHFATDPAANTVTIGSTPAKVVAASATSLQVEVPEVPTKPGADVSLPVIVTVGGRDTAGMPVAVFQAPRIQSVVPVAALPGDTITVNGNGFGAGVKVKFGTTEAVPSGATSTALTVTVPPLQAAPGASIPLTVVSGADASPASPFLLGRLPLLTGVKPASAMPGDILTLSGRGFAPRPADNDVRISGTRALVGAATESQIQVIVPRADASETATLTIKVPGSDHTGEVTIVVAPVPDPIDFRFLAEPFDDGQAHDHAVVLSGLGPVMVLSAAGGRSAGERALEVVQRLNGARDSVATADLEARGLQGMDPVIGLAGKPDTLVRVTTEDAAAYDEDWTKLGGKGGVATPARLAVWWTAVIRDLALLLGRGQKPQSAAALASEGKALLEVHDAAQKAKVTGIPRTVMASLKPPVREGLRVVGFRLPAAVTAAPAPTPPPAPALVGGEMLPPETAAPVGSKALQLDGTWSGNETVGGVPSAMTLTFDGNGGTVSLRRAVSLTIKIQSLQKQKTGVRFRLDMGGKPRHYAGTWDGTKISGTIATDPGGKDAIGTFQLTPSE